MAKQPSIVTGSDAESHEAARAWMNADSKRGRVTTVETLKQTSKVGVYRLHCVGSEAQRVCVKRGRKDGLELERLIYQDILPRLGVPSIHCFGLTMDDAEQLWLLMEDAGDIPYDDTQTAHVNALTDWLASLHSSGENLGEFPLPQLKPIHYKQALYEGRARISANLENKVFADDTRKMLESVIALQDQVEARWDEIVDSCSNFPDTLIHGDIKPKNLRMTEGAPELRVLDWEMAGWGIPAPDLVRVDRCRYQLALVKRGMDVSHSDIDRLSTTGRLFRILAAIDWSSRSLRFEELTKPVKQLEIYQDMLHSILDPDRAN